MKTLLNETDKGNKLIAEFMGYKIKHLGKGDLFTDPTTGFPSTVHGLDFHESWDWLMPVVEKIEQMILKDVIDYEDKNYENEKLRFPICFTANQQEAWIQFYHIGVSGGDAHFDIIKKYSNISKIDAVYNVIIEFIKWYNKENKIQHENK